MSAVGNAVGGFFDGLLGGDEPDNSAQEAFARQQAEMERQQKAQLEQEKRRLDKQKTAMLRGRFSGGATMGANTQGADQGQPANTEAAAANLFTRITGRSDQ